MWANKVWEEKQLPNDNNTSRSTFLHKKGTTYDLNNYRLLSVNCNLCKIFLRVLYNRLQHAVENSEILGEIQIGFRKGRHTTENLGVLTSVIQQCLRTKSELCVAFLDITKAYDRVCRDTLWN